MKICFVTGMEKMPECCCTCICRDSCSRYGKCGTQEMHDSYSPYDDDYHHMPEVHPFRPSDCPLVEMPGRMDAIRMILDYLMIDVKNIVESGQELSPVRFAKQLSDRLGYGKGGVG